MDDQNIRLELYKVYASSIYSFEDRAQVTSRLLVTLNLALTSAIAFGFSSKSINLPIFATLGLIFCAVLFCIVWWLILRSITRHTSAKHEVLQEIEKSFPVKPYTDEWHSKLGSGKGYIKTTTLNEIFPWVFILAYVVLGIIKYTNA
ncbi:hypothetical protein DXX93_13740 [Thalassotalea euphylliae]|uniref:Small integral membrane protein n=1 Tax=Thalassotalea euphylliae TaxID=1655234 RepID=A0A3E0TUB9_9GAMM|nr:hypothetical protein [Thalassotalea euphylliae]REL27515.1 hypothetical protein DXX93_13740 [Thalassotalea euphylliae]